MSTENQSAKNKRITKNTLALYVRMLLLLFIGLYTSRATLAIFGVEDFGIYNLVGGIITMTVFISSSMSLSAQRFLSYAIGLNDERHLKDVFSMSVNTHVIIALLILLVGETVGLWFINTQLIIPEDKLPAANIIYQASVFSFVLNILATPYNSIIIAHEHMDYFALVSVMQGMLKLVIVWCLPYIDGDKLVIYAILMTLPAILYFVMNYMFAVRHFKESTYEWTWSKKLFYEMASFAGYSTFGNMATAVVTQGQSVLLNIFYGTALNAVRGLSMQVSVAINSFVNGTYTAVNPQIIKSYAQKDYEYFHKLIFNSTLLGYYLLFLISLPVILETDFILNLWLKEVPEYTVDFVRLLLINSLIYNFVIPSWMAIQATGNVIKIHLTTGSINLMNLLITYILWKVFDLEPYSIYIVNIAISFCMQVATLIIQREMLHIKIKDYLKQTLWPALSSTAISVIVPLSAFWVMEDGVLRFFIVGGGSVICCLTSFFYLGINDGMRKEVIKYVSNRWTKLKARQQQRIH